MHSTPSAGVRIQSSITYAVMTCLLFLMAFLPQASFANNPIPNGYQPEIIRAQQPFEVNHIEFDKTKQSLSIRGDRGSMESGSQTLSILKLPNPYRLVIDIPNAVSDMKQEEITINQAGIERVSVKEIKGNFFKALRLTVFVDKPETLWHLNIAQLANGVEVSTVEAPGVPSLSDGGIKAKLDNLDLKNKAKDLLPKVLTLKPGDSRNVVDEIYYRDHHLVIKAREQSEVIFKQRFALNGPKRLVLDLDKSVVGNPNLLKPIMIGRDGIHQIRVGQFDDETVRVVVETQEPEAMHMVYPESGKTTAYVIPRADSNVAALPSDVSLGFVDNIFIEKKGNDTIIKVIGSSPMVHRFMKQDDKLYLDLLNLGARSGWVAYEKTTFPELENVRVQPLTAGQPNSKLVVDLADPRLSVKTNLVSNDKVMEIVISKATPTFNSTHIAKAPFSARVVVDAGHGGKDQGASRSGVLEKTLNLEVAQRLKVELERRGVKVYMTRSTDKFLPLPTITSITNNIKPDVFVSVHHNASTNPSLNGIETYYYTAQSLPLAKKVHARMVNNVKAPDRNIRRAMFYVIHHTPAPAILCEVGYVSNSSELRSLQTADRQSRAAAAIADGVVDYLKTRASAKAK